MKAEERKLFKDHIDSYGSHLLYVFDPEGIESSFGYSVGIFERFNHSEIFVNGLKQELTFRILQNYTIDVHNGNRFAINKWYDDIIGNYACFFINVPETKYEDFFGKALDYYCGQYFPIYQLIFPNTSGVYPWHAEWEDRMGYLPILGQIDEVSLKTQRPELFGPPTDRR